MKPKTIQNRARTLTALLLTFVLALSLAAAPLSATAADAALTRGEARDAIVAAAAHYNSGVTATDVMQDGRESEPVTRLEALVMLSRAFGELPEPDNAKILDAADGTYSDVPAWAEPELAKLYAAKILAPATDGVLIPISN